MLYNHIDTVGIYVAFKNRPFLETACIQRLAQALWGPTSSRAPHRMKWSLAWDCHPPSSSTSGFFKLSTADILSQIVICCEDYLVHYRTFNSIFGIYSLDARISSYITKYILGCNIFPSVEPWCKPTLFNSQKRSTWEHLSINILHTNHWICGTPWWFLFIQ